MKTVDGALAFAERVYSRVSDAGIIAAEVRRLREENERLADDMERCYRMLLSEPDVKGALFKAENILRESLADRARDEHQRTDPRPARPD